METTDEEALGRVTAQILASGVSEGATLAMGPALFSALEAEGEIVATVFRCVSNGVTLRLPTYKGRIVWKAHELGAWGCEPEDSYA